MAVSAPVFPGYRKRLVPQLEGAGVLLRIIAVREGYRPVVGQGMMPPGIRRTAAEAQKSLSGRGRKDFEHLFQNIAFDESAQIQPHILPGKAHGALAAVQFPASGLCGAGGRIGRYVEPSPRGLSESPAELKNEKQLFVTGNFLPGGFAVDAGQEAFRIKAVVALSGRSDRFFNRFAPGAGFRLCTVGKEQLTVRMHSVKTGVCKRTVRIPGAIDEFHYAFLTR